MRTTWCVILVFSAPLNARADIALIRNGTSRHEIVLPAGATRVVRLAAKELRYFVGQSTGAQLRIVAEPTPGVGHVFLGPNPASAAIGITPDDLEPEGFHLKAVGEDIHIVGADNSADPNKIGFSTWAQCGTMNGVYELLERCFGVMFCWHDELGTVVPRHTSLTIPALDITDAPDWSYRALAYSPEGATNRLYGRRLRLGHPFTVTHAHAWFRILPVEKYGEEHPEYYAEVNGERQARYYSGHHGGQVCTSNSEVIEIFARAAIEYFNIHPQRAMFSVSPNDGGGFCECSNCLALDGGEMIGPDRPGIPVMTDRLLAFYNAIAERLVKVHPGKLLGAYIYSYYKKPPRREKPHPNLFLVNATNSAHTHGSNWREEHEWERQWTALHKRFYKYDIYYFGAPSLHMIAPVTTHLIDKIKAEHEVGIGGGYLYIGQSYEQLGAGHYLLAKLMWDKDANARELERRYYDALYGTAGPDVLAYYHLLEKRLRDTHLGHVDVDEPAVAKLLERKWSGSSPAQILAAYWPMLDKATDLIERAQGRSLTDIENQRLGRLVDHHEYLVATVRGMVAAGRLEQQTHLDPGAAAMLKEAVDRRAAAVSRIAAYAPTLAQYVEEGDKDETAWVSPRSVFCALTRSAGSTKVVAVRAETPPKIDGLWCDRVWLRAPLNYHVLAKTGAPLQLGVRTAVSFDSDNLYVFVEGREDDTAKLTRHASARDSTAIFTEHNIELFVKPPAGEAYYHIALGAGGSVYDSIHATGTAHESDPTWDSPVRARTEIGETGWSAEMAVPLASFGASVAAEGQWLVNVCCTRRGVADPDEHTAVSPTFGSYHVPPRFARLIFADAPVESRFKYGTFENVPAESIAKSLRFNSEGDASLDITSSRAYCGNQAVHIMVGESSYAGITLEARVKPNTSYRAIIAHYNSVRALRPDVRADAPRTRIIFRSKAGKAVTDKSEYSWDGAEALDSPNRWRITSHLFTTPVRTERISLTLFFHHPGEYWVDELRLDEL